MTFYECYEKRRDSLYSRLSQAKTLSEGAAALSDSLDAIMSDFASASSNEELTELASYMVSALKNSFLLFECANETRLWERNEKGETVKPKRWPAALCLGFGAALAAGLIYIFIAQHPDLQLEGFGSWLGVLALTLILIFVAGLLFARRPKALSQGKTETRVDIKINAADAVRRLSAVMLQMDKNLAAYKASLLQGGGASEPLSGEEADFIATLIEEAYSEEGELAALLKRETKQYLKRRGVELRDYDGKVESDFELLPGEGIVTLRPALIYEGRLLKKGLATYGEGLEL